jgi:hypothetical protein
LLVAGCNQPHWQEFSSPAGHFSATFPAPPKEQVKPLTTSEGPVDIHEFVATVGARAFLVTYSDYAQGEDVIPAAQRLAGWHSSLMTNRKLLAEREVTADGIPGKEVTLETTDNLRITARAFYRGKRLYQAVVATPAAAPQPDDTARFLESLKILPE